MTGLILSISLISFMVLVLFYIGHFTEYGKLAKKFKCETFINPESYFKCETIGISFGKRSVEWFSVIYIRAIDDGLYLGVHRYFKWFFPSVLIPWENIKSCKGKYSIFGKRIGMEINSIKLYVNPKHKNNIVKYHPQFE